MYMSHRSENCFVKSSDQQSIKDRLGKYQGNRDYAVNHYKNSEHKWKKKMKALKKQNKILYRIAKKSVSRNELKKIKNIKAKASKMHRYYISDSSSSG